MLGLSLFLRIPTQSVFGKMEVSLPAIQDMKYREVTDLGTGYGLTVEEGGLGNGKNLISESKGLSPGKPNPGHPVSLSFLPGSVCLGLQQKQGKENIHWQEISSDKRLPSSGGSSQSPTARKLGEALKKCQPASTAGPSPFSCHRVSGIPGWSQAQSRFSRLVKTI